MAQWGPHSARARTECVTLGIGSSEHTRIHFMFFQFCYGRRCTYTVTLGLSLPVQSLINNDTFNTLL